MANEHVKRSFHSIDHKGHIVEGGPLDERLRNLECLAEGRRDRMTPGLDTYIEDRVKSEVTKAAASLTQASPYAVARVGVGGTIDARIDKAIARLDAIESAMRLMCTAVHGSVPASAAGFAGELALHFSQPTPLLVKHVRLADDSAEGLRISRIRCGVNFLPGDGNIDAIVTPNDDLVVTVENTGAQYANVSVLFFYEKAPQPCEAMEAMAKAYAKGYDYGYRGR